MEKILTLFLFCAILHFAKCSMEPFECFVCNKDPHEDDALPCIERLEACAPNVTSCSSVAFRTVDGKLRTRKFCTSPGVPIYQYLMLFPGSSLCQNIETSSAQETVQSPEFVPGPNKKPIVASPPAPPPKDGSTMLCVCTRPRCNGGTYRDVMERNMLRNLEVPGAFHTENKVKKFDETVPNRKSNPTDFNFL